MKAIISYIMVFISTVLYMLLFDKDAGMIMTIFIFVTPVISIWCTVLAAKRLKFQTVIYEENIRKDSVGLFQVNVSKDTFIPTPIISFNVHASERFEKLKHTVYKFSMSEIKEINVDIELIPYACGPAEIYIDEIYITDYLGIFKFKVKNAETELKKAYIIPDIPELDDADDILHSIYMTLPDNDDDDESFTSSGRAAVPGYEYREYAAGDPLKKVNWKLSAKKGSLYVRKDEQSAITLPNIIIDTALPLKSDDMLINVMSEEQLIENSLSLLSLCVRNGIECTYTFFVDSILIMESVSSYSDIEKLAIKISRTEFGNGSLNIKSSENKKSTDVNIIYTLNLSENLILQAEENRLNGSVTKFVVLENTLADNSNHPVCSDVWTVEPGNCIHRYC